MQIRKNYLLKAALGLPCTTVLIGSATSMGTPIVSITVFEKFNSPAIK